MEIIQEKGEGEMMSNKDKMKILDDILESLNNLDKLVTIDGYNDLWSAKQQTVILKTILNIEEKMNEDEISE